jgi:hypothetical protein
MREVMDARLFLNCDVLKQLADLIEQHDGGGFRILSDRDRTDQLRPTIRKFSSKTLAVKNVFDGFDNNVSADDEISRDTDDDIGDSGYCRNERYAEQNGGSDYSRKCDFLFLFHDAFSLFLYVVDTGFQYLLNVCICE